ncbi:Ger(x)C family spore germination C-terminal domain-containing protein [Paenibacillus polysaccharolyticus]|uniref:Ger(x)C family spore germination C-terminal domain-containing protein n=1 Tax=Paenibacillus polysaccharolyticus TaxID=582692 RepID=UPI0020A21FF4|nr:Ger(x)C family spore germination C-terminal domain-containing protein [Paenibacillus polysaccharolyticus]MCP1136225.1 Ger(x)C family spore germination C-terminal domain-containing protein [Paenibacillus polysaccharolyticus]
MNEEEMGLIALLNRQKSNVHLTVEYNGEPVEFVISHSKLNLVSRITGVRPKFIYKGNLTFDVDVHKSKLGAVVSPDDIARMEELLSQKLNSKLTELVHKVNTRYRSNVWGLADHLYRYRPSYWKQHNEDWDAILPDIDIDFYMKIHIKNLGLHL